MKPLPPDHYEYHWDPVLQKNVADDRAPYPPGYAASPHWMIVIGTLCILTGLGLVAWSWLSYR